MDMIPEDSKIIKSNKIKFMNFMEECTEEYLAAQRKL